MKIAFLHFWTFRMRRGVETMVVSLANELANLGHDISIVTASPTVEPLVKPDARVRVQAYPTFRYFEFFTIAPFYAVNLLAQKYDVVMVFFADFGEGLALRLIEPYFKSRLVLNLTFPLESAPHRYRAYTRWKFHQKAEIIVADARYTATRGQEYLKRPVEFLPSGTDPQRFHPDNNLRLEARRQLGFRDDEIILLNVAALEKRKGIWRVIEALPQIRAQIPSIRYMVLGEGPEKEQLRQRVAELGLDTCVMFAGTSTNLPFFYNASDIFVMLSDAEAGSVACLEAMSSDLPVVVANTGGFSDVVDETMGRIVDIRNQQEIAAAIIELAGNSALREQLGAAARERILNQFSWSKIAEQLIQICQE